MATAATEQTNRYPNIKREKKAGRNRKKTTITAAVAKRSELVSLGASSSHVNRRPGS